MTKKQFKNMCRELGMLTDEGKIDYDWVALLMWLQRNGVRREYLQSEKAEYSDLYEKDLNIIDKYMKEG